MYFLGKILKFEITLTETVVFLVQIASQHVDIDLKKNLPRQKRSYISAVSTKILLRVKIFYFIETKIQFNVFIIHCDIPNTQERAQKPKPTMYRECLIPQKKLQSIYFTQFTTIFSHMSKNVHLLLSIMRLTLVIMWINVKHYLNVFLVIEGSEFNQVNKYN